MTGGYTVICTMFLVVPAIAIIGSGDFPVPGGFGVLLAYLLWKSSRQSAIVRERAAYFGIKS